VEIICFVSKFAASVMRFSSVLSAMINIKFVDNIMNYIFITK